MLGIMGFLAEQKVPSRQHPNPNPNSLSRTLTLTP